MEKRYTLPVAIALVVGTVIGSGVFFKAEAVLVKTGGNMGIGILAFLIMGVVMIISACTFGLAIAVHSACQPGKPSLQGDGQRMICSGCAHFQRAKSAGLRFSLCPSRSRVVFSTSSRLRPESFP